MATSHQATANTNIDITEIESGNYSMFEQNRISASEYPSYKTKITKTIGIYENEIKNTIMNNSDQTIKLFNHTKQIKEEFQKSKRNLESLESQILILKKKYIEPYEKFHLNITNKKNIDQTIKVFDSIKVIKTEIELMKIYFDNDRLVATDLTNIMVSFLKLKKSLKNDILKDINIISEEIKWFKAKEELIMAGFVEKFTEAVNTLDNKQIKKFFSFFNSLDKLTKEVRDCSNSILRETLSGKYFKKIASEIVNSTSNFDNDHINKIRREHKDFFEELVRWVKIIENLSRMLKSEFDSESLVRFDEILESNNLKEIYDLFTERIDYTFNQIFNRAKTNEKFQNMLTYFTKDFLFFYLCIKRFCAKSGCAFKIFNFTELKSIYLEKFKTSLNENLTRAISLIKTQEKNFVAANNSDLLKPSITDYFSNYINQINLVLIELDFEYEVEMKEDEFIKELIEVFNEMCFSQVLQPIYASIEGILQQCRGIKTNDVIVKSNLFYYYLSVLLRINQFFTDSLVKDHSKCFVESSFQQAIETKLGEILAQFFNLYLTRIIKDIKIIYVNKEFIYLKTFLEKFSIILNDFFTSLPEDLVTYKAFDVSLKKFCTYIYLYVMQVLVLSIPPIEQKENIVFVDFFINIFNQVFKLKDTPIFIKVHDIIKKALSMSEGEIREIQNTSSLKKHEVLLFKIRSLFFNESKLIKFLQENKMNIETLGKLLSHLYLNSCYITYKEFVVVENQITLTETVKAFLKDV